MRYVKSNEEKFIHFKIKSNEQSTHPLSCELDRRNEAKQQPFYCCATALEMPQPCKPQTLTMAMEINKPRNKRNIKQNN